MVYQLMRQLAAPKFAVHEYESYSLSRTSGDAGSKLIDDSKSEHCRRGSEVRMEIRVGIQSGVVASDGCDGLFSHTLEPRRTCTDGYQWPVPKCASMKSAVVLCGMSNERSRVRNRMSAYLHASGKMRARNIYVLPPGPSWPLQRMRELRAKTRRAEHADPCIIEVRGLAVYRIGPKGLSQCARCVGCHTRASPDYFSII